MNDVLQQALAGEHAAVFACGRAGGRLTGQQQAARLAEEEHRAARDRLRQLLVEAGETPVAPMPGYLMPNAVRTPSQARAALAEVELRLIPLYTALASDTTAAGPQRAWAVGRSQDCAVRALTWGAAPAAFPWPDGVTSIV